MAAAVDGRDGPHGPDGLNAEEMAHRKSRMIHNISRDRTGLPCISHLDIGSSHCRPSGPSSPFGPSIAITMFGVTDIAPNSTDTTPFSAKNRSFSGLRICNSCPDGVYFQDNQIANY